MNDRPDEPLPAELLVPLPRRVAHALRGPLGLVLSALRELHRPDDPMLALGHRGALQLQHLADRLSLLGRLLQGERSRPQPVDLVTLLDQSVDRVTRVRPRRHVDVCFGPRPDSARVLVDPDHVGGALVELLDNAMRFARSSVEVSIRERPAGWRLEIVDDGPGPAHTAMPGEHAPGLGIGLHLVRAVAAAHDAGFSLLDREGTGGVAVLDVRLDPRHA